MPEPSRPVPNPVSPALLAFLRGIECRAWIFALAQCGDAARADAILASALREFAVAAQAQALAQWPLRFWTILLGQPAMLTGHAGDTALSMLAPGPRAALLLRLVAGLDPAHAMQALGISAAAHDLALRRAQLLWQGDRQGIERLRDDLHAQVQQMPQARRQELAALRDRALADAAVRVEAPPVRAANPRWQGFSKFLLALLLLGFAATFYPYYARWFSPAPDKARSSAPAGQGSQLDETAIVIHPDYDQLAAPEDDALAQQLAFLSWMQAGGDSPGAMVAPVSGLSETAAAESAAADAEIGSTP